MSDFFPQIEIFRKRDRGGGVKPQNSSRARTRPFRIHIFFLVRRNLLSPDQKKNKEKSPAYGWKRGVFHQRSAARLNNLILEGLNNG